MARTILGGLVGGIVLFVLGYVFWATPLGDIPYKHASIAQNAAIQTALATNLTPTGSDTGIGTGTYIVPDYHSAGGAVLYGKGPIATIDFNTAGFSHDDLSMLLPGFIVALASGLLFAFGLAAVGGGGRSFAGMARLVVLASLGFTTWEFLGAPIFNHYGWGYWIYAFIAESVSLIAAGLVIARWFLPRTRSVAATPSEGPSEARAKEG
jgi:hypothetical protein